MSQEPGPEQPLAVDADDGRRALRLARTIAPGVLLVGMVGGIAFPILPAVGLRAGLSLPFIGLILAANRITRIIASPLAGLLADRIGGRRLMLAGLVIQIGVMALYLGGVVAGQPGPYFLIARILHGPGSAGVFVAAQVLSLHAGGRRHTGATSGVIRGALLVGMPSGLVLGGLLAARWGERATFEAAIVAVVLATVVVAALVPDLRAPGSLPRRGLRDLVRVLADRRLAAVAVLNMVAFFAAQGTVLTTAVLYVRARGMVISGLGDQGTASAVMAALILVSAAISAPAGRIGDRRRAHAPIATAGIALLAIGMAVSGLANNLPGLMIGVGLVGAGSGALSPSLLALAGQFVGAERRGSAVGALQLFADIGGALGPIAGASLFAAGITLPYLASAAVVICALPLGVWLVGVTRGSDGSPRATGSQIEGDPDT